MTCHLNATLKLYAVILGYYKHKITIQVHISRCMNMNGNFKMQIKKLTRINSDELYISEVHVMGLGVLQILLYWPKRPVKMLFSFG